MKPRVLKSQTPSSENFWPRYLRAAAATAPRIDSAVSKIIADVRKRGDRALIDLTAQIRRREAYRRPRSA